MASITPIIKRCIEENPVALATAGKQNKPNVIPVAYVKVVAKNKVVITNACMQQTVKNIQQNRNVCLSVWDKKWEGYKLI